MFERAQALSFTAPVRYQSARAGSRVTSSMSASPVRCCSARRATRREGGRSKWRSRTGRRSAARRACRLPRRPTPIAQSKRCGELKRRGSSRGSRGSCATSALPRSSPTTLYWPRSSSGPHPASHAILPPGSWAWRSTGPLTISDEARASSTTTKRWPISATERRTARKRV